MLASSSFSFFFPPPLQHSNIMCIKLNLLHNRWVIFFSLKFGRQISQIFLNIFIKFLKFEANDLRHDKPWQTHDWTLHITFIETTNIFLPNVTVEWVPALLCVQGIQSSYAGLQIGFPGCFCYGFP